jgi:purine catabolism regulator
MPAGFATWTASTCVSASMVPMWQAFDVGAVVDFLPGADVAVVAGAGGMRRIVTRAHLAATAEELRRRVGSGDLVVTSAATLLESGDDPAHVVARLDAAQVAGVAVRLERAGETLPDDLLAAADRVALPVITFPETTTVADATAAVLDALLEAQRQRLDHVLDIHQRFTRIVLAGGGAPEIAATLHEVVGHPVAVVDTDRRATVVVPSDATVDVDSATVARQRIRAGDVDYGEIVVDAGDLPLDADSTIALERASMGIAVRLAQASAVAEAQERFAAVSLEELISGHAGDVAEITERAITFGWDLSRPRAVLLASIDPADDVDGRTRPVPAGALAMIAAAARATLGPDAIVWTRSATIAALVAPASDDPLDRREIAEALQRELDVRLRSVSVSIGVGRRVDTPAALPRSFAEASRAVDVGRWAKGRHVTEVFDQLGLERLLATVPPGDLQEFVRDAIGRLLEHDAQNTGELVDTLAVWLETRNMAEAARRMHVHYNTLKNRLERIEGIVGPVVADSARALECEIAIYITRHYEV